MRRIAALVCVVCLLVAGCRGPEPEEPVPADAPTDTPAAGTPEGTGPGATPDDRSASPGPTLTPTPRVAADDVRRRTAVRTVEYLAGRIGPRPGTAPAYGRAADWVQGRLDGLGWEVRRQRFHTPGGVSWGVAVEAGRSVNLIATRGDVAAGEPWLLVGAHLDTVPQSPGAEDNASGVGALLAVAEAVAERRTRLPVVLVIFGSEEPRGPSDEDHHYGSRAYVDSLGPAQRRTLRGMVSLDRVGVGAEMPIGTVAADDPLGDELRRAARRAGVAATVTSGQRSSDHWSFVRDGLPGARLGSTSYAAYHSPDDLPGVVDPAQLERAARLTVAWLR